MPLHKPRKKTNGEPQPSRASGSVKKPSTATTEIRLLPQYSKNFDWKVEQIKRNYNHKRHSPMPQDVKPMLASITEEAFNHKDWQFEIKWDGYRALAYVADGEAALRSRNNLSFAEKYSPVTQALKEWPVNVVVDGELVILSDEGKSDFGALQNWPDQQQGELLFYIFDLLWVEGIDLRDEPLWARRKILKDLLPDDGCLRFSDAIDECGIDFFSAARNNGLEGIIAKQKNAPYKAGARTDNWLKVKAETRHEAIICGYTKKRDTDRLFSSLILGIPNKDGLQFIGQVGTGFNRQQQKDILEKLEPLHRKNAPFTSKPLIKDPVQWVKPALVGEVKYTELTADGLMRHPSFQGLRIDKTGPDINLEVEKITPVSVAIANNAEDSGALMDARTITIDGHSLQLTNLSKIYWPQEKITKRNVLDYYAEVAPYLLPYMHNRPQSLNRFPNGINGQNFYQKDMKGKVPAWLKTFQRFSESNGDTSDFLVCTNTASLLYMANLGCIEMNPWHSKVTNPLHPDWCVLDLDPGDIPFQKVIETAQVIHQLVDSLGIPSYPKTSGSTGLHIYLPLGAKYNYDQSRQLAELLANLVHAELPKFTSLVRSPEKRKEKIYIDYLQNRPIQTICAPYSIRPKKGATVSAPLHWDEVKTGLKMKQFTLSNMMDRVRTEGDLFDGVLGTGIDLNSVLKSIVGLM